MNECNKAINKYRTDFTDYKSFVFTLKDKQNVKDLHLILFYFTLNITYMSNTPSRLLFSVRNIFRH